MIIPKIEELNSATCRTCSFQKRWPEFYKYLLQTYPSYAFSEKLALYYHNLNEPPVCAICGGPVRFINFKSGWRRTCCSKCQGADPDVIAARKHTLTTRYGADNPGKVEKFQQKMKQTCLKRYGVENVGWTKESQQKIKATNIARRGTEYPMQSEEVREKSKHTCLLRYGAEHNTSAQPIKDKVAATNILKYGGIGYASPELFKKVMQTCSERFGCLPVKNASQIPEVREKILRTKRETFISNSHDVIGYTPEYYWVCKCPHPECNKCTEKQYIIPPDIKRNRERIGAEVCTTLLPVRSQHSTIELWVCDILDGLNIKYEVGNRSVLSGKEIDIYCPDYRVGFECNGIYWHSSLYKGNTYHRDKTTDALKCDIRLYHIWEDWVHNSPDILKSMIMNWLGASPNKIFARKCEVREVSRPDGKNFLTSSHIQGSSPFNIGYGLYYNDQLVSLMTFGHKRGCVGRIDDKGSKNEWELIRFCSAIGTNVVGGASKLLYHFIKAHNPTCIYSYASCDISVGGVYKQLGFSSDRNITSSYWYIDPTTFKRYHRTSFTKDRIVRRGWKSDKSGWTESEVMAEHGYLQIYDAGQTKWVLTL